PQFYTPCVRAGGRLPHSWVPDLDLHVSTLELVSRDELTLLVYSDGQTAWSRAAQGLPISLVPLGKAAHEVFDTGVAGGHSDALVVRPDGHIAASLRSDRHGAASLRQVLSVVGAASPTPAKGG